MCGFPDIYNFLRGWELCSPSAGTVVDTRGGGGGKGGRKPPPNNFYWSISFEKWKHKKVFHFKKWNHYLLFSIIYIDI